MPVKDILRSKFTWHITQLTNNDNHEILFWKALIFFFFTLSVWPFVFYKIYVQL